MIQQIDIEDFKNIDCTRARVALENLDDIARMAKMIPVGPYKAMKEFIDAVEILQRKYIPQTAALFKKETS